jgi:hypothetical protein
MVSAWWNLNNEQLFNTKAAIQQAAFVLYSSSII